MRYGGLQDTGTVQNESIFRHFDGNEGFQTPIGGAYTLETCHANAMDFHNSYQPHAGGRAAWPMCQGSDILVNSELGWDD